MERKLISEILVRILFHGHLKWKEKERRKFDNDKNRIVIHDIHEALEDESKVKILAAYLRCELTY